MLQWDRIVGSLLRVPQIPGSTNCSVGSRRFFIAKLLLLFELQLSVWGAVRWFPGPPLGPKAQLGGCGMVLTEAVGLPAPNPSVAFPMLEDLQALSREMSWMPVLGQVGGTRCGQSIP